MSKRKIRMLVLSCLLGLFIMSAMFVPSTKQKANAEEEPVDPLGLFVSLSLNINGGGGQVWATVKNEFTLFPSTIQVYVELYYSYEYQESYVNMTLAGSNYIYDLDQGKTIQTYGNTNGQILYWQARMRYKNDENDWKEKTTDTIKCDGEGNWLKEA